MGIHPKTNERVIFEFKGLRPYKDKRGLEDLYGRPNFLSELYTYSEIKEHSKLNNYEVREYVRYK